jgi:hypothetical protein
LDARVLAYAALHALYASGLKLPVHCDRFARMVQTRRGETPTIPAATKPANTAQPARPPIERGEDPWIPRRNWFGRN